MSGSGKVRARTYVWNPLQADRSFGVLLRDRRGQVITHLSIPEARKLADQLHDAADAAEHKQEAQSGASS
ncbi:MAG: hypothetical protein J0I04_02465 [Paenarthrobacter ureafaciens]|uniref:hypothetical protein n=1 Tax=Paenarthrobacter ureafaciens TaxID=37931 RepID=UPI001ACE8E17|nr:hypothetical protein [Paenarthrobacter ureafaciens]MBN9128502.1 hypothetical protein [Paenarthrobacter ureafaciens]